MGVLALKLVEFTEVPDGGASERGHILDQDHPSPEHIEVQRVALQCGGPQVVEGLGDEGHLSSWASALDVVGMRVCARGHPSRTEKAAFHGCQMALQETDPQLTHNTLRVPIDAGVACRVTQNMSSYIFEQKQS